MYKIIFILFLLVFSSCGSSSSDIYSDSKATRACIEPYNPYSAGGHYAGYEWAREQGRTCSGNSDSFINGCEEYYAQLEDYNSCTN